MGLGLGLGFRLGFRARVGVVVGVRGLEVPATARRKASRKVWSDPWACKGLGLGLRV